MSEKEKDVLGMCIPASRLEVLQDIAERNARWALGPENKRTEEITILYSNYFSEELIDIFMAAFAADPNIWCLTVRSKQGHELTIYEGMHPLSPERDG